MSKRGFSIARRAGLGDVEQKSRAAKGPLVNKETNNLCCGEIDQKGYEELQREYGRKKRSALDDVGDVGGAGDRKGRWGRFVSVVGVLYTGRGSVEGGRSWQACAKRLRVVVAAWVG